MTVATAPSHMLASEAAQLAAILARGEDSRHQGLGSGILRAIEDWPHIEFVDDRAGNQFKVILRRAEFLDGGVTGGVSGGVNGAVKTADRVATDLLHAIRQNPGQRAPALAKMLSVNPKKIEHWIRQLRVGGLIEFVGTPRTGGYHAKQPNGGGQS